MGGGKEECPHASCAPPPPRTEAEEPEPVRVLAHEEDDGVEQAGARLGRQHVAADVDLALRSAAEQAGRERGDMSRHSSSAAPPPPPLTSVEFVSMHSTSAVVSWDEWRPHAAMLRYERRVTGRGAL